MASMCSLAQHTTEGWSNTFVGEHDRRRLAGDLVARAGAVQRRTRQAQSGAVLRCGLLRAHPEPIRTVENIYEHFGIEMTDEARAAIQRTDEESKQGPRAPKHTYSLADYGLTEEQVKERFKGL